MRCPRGTPPKGPERGPQGLGQRGEAPAAAHHAGMVPAATGQHEVMETVGEGRVGDGDAELVRRAILPLEGPPILLTVGVLTVGEVRRGRAARLRGLTEDHVPGLAVRAARQSRTRRSKVRRMRSSGNASGSPIYRGLRSVTACTAGSFSRIGSSSVSQTAASGPWTVRPRSGWRCDGRRGSVSIRRPVRSARTRPGRRRCVGCDDDGLACGLPLAGR